MKDNPTTMTVLRFAPLIRVSTEKQKKRGESLATQKKQITDYVTALHGVVPDSCWLYSGQEHSTPGYERQLLDRLLEDSSKDLFDAVIVVDISRWGRNNLKSEQAVNILIKNKIRFFIGTAEMNLNDPTQRFYVVMGVAVNQLTAQISTIKSIENRFYRAKDSHIPTNNKKPFARTFDKKTSQWVLDEAKAQKIRTAADLYLSGKSLYDVSLLVGMKYDHLNKILKNRCGATWTMDFKGRELVPFDVPRLLDDATIKEIHERLAFNRRNNRRDVTNKYVLTGFIFCEHCNRSLSGQTQRKNEVDRMYYTHPSNREHNCHAFSSIGLKQIERAVFSTIFENFADVPSFERAISESMPDEAMINDLQDKIRVDKSALNKINGQLDKLITLAMEGTLSKETIREREHSLTETKLALQESLGANTRRLQSLPDFESVRSEADQIRRQLLEKYSGLDRMLEMSFDEKRTLLHWLFDGKDKSGSKYGIYVTKRGDEIDYFMYGRIVGLRTVKGDDINYDTEYKTNSHIS
jgi:site-specific DNA recombinase